MLYSVRYLQNVVISRAYFTCAILPFCIFPSLFYLWCSTFLSICLSLYPVSPCLSVILCPPLYLPVYLPQFPFISFSPCLSFFFSSVYLSLYPCIFPLFLLHLSHHTSLYLFLSDALLPCLPSF